MLQTSVELAPGAQQGHRARCGVSLKGVDFTPSNQDIAHLVDRLVDELVHGARNGLMITLGNLELLLEDRLGAGASPNEIERLEAARRGAKKALLSVNEAATTGRIFLQYLHGPQPDRSDLDDT